MDIYLDFNVYLSILKREINSEINYEYIFSKLRRLRRYRQDIQFPYSPAHMEEVAVNLNKSDDAKKLISKRLNMIESISLSYEYLPGVPSRDDVVKNLNSIPCTPELMETRRQLEMVLNLYDKGLLIEEPATKKVTEKPMTCFKRVVGDLEATDWAHHNDVFHLGRRNEKSLQTNFDSIQKNSDGIETFVDYQKKRKLGPKNLSSLEPSKVFKLEVVQKALADYLKKNSECQIIKGRELLSNHDLLEGTITLVLNFLEKIGYNQEENNKLVKLRSRMHDVTHAIYGAQADYFVTADRRYRKKLEAAYSFLEIPCKVLSPDKFVTASFKGQEVIILNKQINKD